MAFRLVATLERWGQRWWHAHCSAYCMLDWSLLLFALSLVAKLLGLTALAAGAAAAAEVVLYALAAVVALGLLGAFVGGNMP